MSVLSVFHVPNVFKENPMLRKGWLLTVGLVLALPGMSAAQTKKEVPAKGSINAFTDCTAAPGNLVANCGFEDGGGSFVNWTLAGDLVPFVTVDPVAAHSGSFGAHLGPVNYFGLMTQVLPTTPGQVCQLSFWLRNSGRPASFEVRFGPLQVSPATPIGVPALHSVIENVPDMIYTQYTYTGLVVSSDATTLNFAFYNVPSFMDLDDIAVVCSS